MLLDPFFKACHDGDLDGVCRHLHEFDPNKTDKTGMTALMFAAIKGHVDIVNAVLPVSDARQTDENGWTALMFAAINGHAEVVKVLLPVSDAHQAEKDGWTAMMWAAGNDNVDVVEALLLVSDLNQKNRNGERPLDRALINQAWGAVDVLAAHENFETLVWPKQATPEDLPLWCIRVEQKALSEALVDVPQHSDNTPSLKTRPRL